MPFQEADIVCVEVGNSKGAGKVKEIRSPALKVLLIGKLLMVIWVNAPTSLGTKVTSENSGHPVDKSMYYYCSQYA